MSIEQYTNPFQPHTESEFLSSKEVSKIATGLLNSFDEYVKTTGQKTKLFIEEKISDGWDWKIAFKAGKTKKARELLIQRREENSEEPFTSIVVDTYNIFLRTPNINEKGTLSHSTSYNTKDIANQATEFVETFTHPTES